ncbi:DUF1491 family protein [Sandarakinorhabdus sp.]|uniref:DUF1491 family protein n=1 Tax=Sandarakinorhabdus sp. TaxID=1916663 RepID=UPI00286DC365|nr:DUF1491 family protein [Sandarakinorhabdus sp.]
MIPRLASGIKISALLRGVAAAGGFGVVVARGDDTAGAIAIVTRERGETALIAPMPASSGGHEWVVLARDESVSDWIERARRRDPDLWIIELDIPDAARFVARTLGDD